MKINFNADDVTIPRFPRKKIKSWIALVAKGHSKEVGEIAYYFCDDEQILEVNKTFLAHDYYTDIITFDYSVEETVSADIYISLDTVKSNAKQFNQTYLSECYRVIIHGVLHLCGLKDKSEEEQLVMRNAEDEALSLLYNTILNNNNSI